MGHTKKDKSHVVHLTKEDVEEATKPAASPAITVYATMPHGGKEPIPWIPVHRNAMSSRMENEALVRMGNGPYDVMFLSLLDPTVCQMADKELWPVHSRFTRQKHGVSYSDYLRDRLHFGALVNANMYEYWRDTHIKDPAERANLVDWIEVNDNMHRLLPKEEHDNNANKAAPSSSSSDQSHTTTDGALNPDEQVDVLQARRQHEEQVREKTGMQWLRFSHDHAHSRLYVMRVAAHRAGMASYLKRQYSAAPEFEQMKARRDMFHPHVPQSFYGYLQAARAAWYRGSLHQVCAPHDLPEIDARLEYAASTAQNEPRLAALHFDEQKELGNLSA